jgi:hypothetical protein
VSGSGGAVGGGKDASTAPDGGTPAAKNGCSVAGGEAPTPAALGVSIVAIALLFGRGRGARGRRV